MSSLFIFLFIKKDISKKNLGRRRAPLI